MNLSQRNVQSYRSRKPYIRVILVVVTIIILVLIGRKLAFLSPYLSDKYKMFSSVNGQLDTPATNMPPAEQKNHYQKIINGLNKAIDRDPLNEYAYLLLGRACWYKSGLENNRDVRFNLLEKAHQNLRKGFALLKNDHYPSYHAVLGDIYMAKGEDFYFDALKEYQAAKRLHYFPIAMEKKMSFIYLKKGEYRQAAKLFQSLLKAEKSPENFLFMAECEYHLGRPDTAEQYLHYVIDAYKEEAPERYEPHFLAEAFFYLGKVYADKQSWDRGRSHMEKALSIEPENTVFMAGLQKLYKDSGQSKAAIDMGKRIKSMENLLMSRTNIKPAGR